MQRRDFIYGRNPVLEMLQQGELFEQILLQKGIELSFIREVKGLASPLNIPVHLVPKEKMQRITMKNHQGVIGFTAWVDYREMAEVVQEIYEAGRTPVLLLLDGITDVRNVGAIARSAEVFGVDALVVPFKGAARIGADAVKTSAGAITRITLCRERSIAAACQVLQKMGLKVMVADQRAERRVYQCSFAEPVAIVVGGEGEGVYQGIRDLADIKFSIPQLGVTDSLNVSVAAGIILYEATRQRTTM